MNFFARLLAAMLCLSLSYGTCAEKTVEAELQELEDDWAETFYRLPARQQTEKYNALLPRVRELKARHPQRAEPLILEAVVLCTLAASDWGFSSLTRINDARALLVKSIAHDPRAMHASAYITLGNLYHRLPGWPISFGDDELALQYLEAAHRMFPDSLDSNYFLGDYWLHEDEYDKALPFLEKADLAPIRAAQRLSDEKLKEELKVALNSARQRKGAHTDFFSDLLPDIDN